MSVLIYSLVCPLTDEVRYIGKTSQEPERRLWAHLAAAKRRTTKGGTRKELWLRKLLRNGLRPNMVIIGEVADGQHWSDAERAEIAKAGTNGARLTNMTLGGDGSSMVSAEKRAKLSAAAKRRATPEYRAMMAARSLAAWNDPEKRARIEAGITPEVRAKVSAASKAMWMNPDKASAALSNFTKPESQRKLAQVRQTSEYRDNQRKARSTPEYRARASESQKLAWQRRRELKG